MHPAVIRIMDERMQRMKADWGITAQVGLIDSSHLPVRTYSIVNGRAINLGHHQYRINLRGSLGIVDGLIVLAHELRHVMDWESGRWVGWVWDGVSYIDLAPEKYYRLRPWEIEARRWEQHGMEYI